MPANVIAASSAIAIDMPLTPINTTESISLVAYFLHADLRCDDAGCVVQVAQTYQVRNQGQETTLELGLPAEEGLPSYALRFEGGAALEPGAPSADYARPPGPSHSGEMSKSGLSSPRVIRHSKVGS
jgi:hypothetical protein